MLATAANMWMVRRLALGMSTATNSTSLYSLPCHHYETLLFSKSRRLSDILKSNRGEIDTQTLQFGFASTDLPLSLQKCTLFLRG